MGAMRLNPESASSSSPENTLTATMSAAIMNATAIPYFRNLPLPLGESSEGGSKFGGEGGGGSTGGDPY